MLKTIAFYAIIVIICVVAGNVTITFIPFSFKLQKPIFSAGLLVFIIGLSMMFYSKFNEGRKKGHQDVIEILEKPTAPAPTPGEQP